MAIEPIPFHTGTLLSSDPVVAITAGTNVADLSAAEQNAKNRKWEITTTTAGANMPYNPYRRSLVVDATQSTEDAFVVVNNGDDPSSTVFVHRVEAGGYAELTRALGEIGPEPTSVVVGGTTVTPVTIIERSAV